VEGERHGRFPFGNALVLESPGRPVRRILVDTGVGDQVLRMVLERGPVDVVVNTHYHIDHVRGNGPVADRYPEVRFWCPEGEEEAFRSWEGFLAFTGLNARGRAVSGPADLGWRAVPVDRTLGDGDALGLPGLEARVVRLPGHTPGHSGLVFPRERVVFSADIEFGGFGPWYGDVYGDPDAYLDSLARLERLVDEVSEGGRRGVTVVTSHRRPLDYAAFKERLPRFRVRLLQRDERILAILRRDGPLTQDEVAARWPVYGPGAPDWPGIPKAEYLMTGHHLRRLERLGLVVAEPAAGRGREGGVIVWRVT